MIRTRRFLLLPLGVLLVVQPGIAQTHAGLLEKGIFLEETAGDLDGASRIYREIVAAHGVTPDVASQARVRLSEIMDRKTATAKAPTPAAQRSPFQGCCGMFSGNYDEGRPVTVAGTVSAVMWVNPQAVLFVDVGDGRNWGFTLAAPNQMVQFGMARTAIKVGEQVLVSGYLARGAGENCPGQLPNACETLLYPAMSKLAEQRSTGALHASASVITAADGRILFDRLAMESKVATVQH
jgi:Family of unknown function (DUF6152)